MNGIIPLDNVLLSNYRYLIEANPLWLINWPGMDNRQLSAATRQLAGERWQLSDLLPGQQMPTIVDVLAA